MIEWWYTDDDFLVISLVFHWCHGGQSLQPNKKRLWFIDFLVHWFISSFVDSFSCAWILSCHLSGISTSICWFVAAPDNFNTSLRLHLKNCPIAHLPTIAVFNVKPSASTHAGHYLVLWSKMIWTNAYWQQSYIIMRMANLSSNDVSNVIVNVDDRNCCCNQYLKRTCWI